MGVTEDVRKVIQDLVGPDLKSLCVMVKLEALSVKMDAQYQ